MDRFGDAIEYDLAVRQVDLVTEWGKRRFRYLLNLINHLPRNSAYVQALTDDDEWAEQVLASAQSNRPAHPRMQDWSPELELLTSLYDRVGELVRVSVAATGSRPKRLQPAPRPVTALDRARARRRKAQHQRLVTTMLPHRATDGRETPAT